ncbi:MAG: ABC transporter ATP-binding protein [Verrucomicrobia bacterium]|nr:ABC transporter ATP-binding protein [Verrucomicrobiota bacterium]
MNKPQGPPMKGQKPGVARPSAPATALPPRPSGAAPQGPAFPTAKAEPIPWGRLFRWAWRVTSGARGVFIAGVALLLVSSLLTIYQPLLLGQVIQQLNRVAARSDGGPAMAKPSDDARPGDTPAPAKKPAGEKPAPSGGGFFARLMPGSLTGLAWVFFIVVMASVAATFLARVAGSVADVRITQVLQQRMHDKVLTLGPSFHAAHELGQTSATVIQFSQGAQQMLCELFRSLLVQVVTFVLAVLALISQLTAGTSVPTAWIVVLLALLVVLPVVGWWLSKLLRASSTELRDALVAVQNEFMNSGTSPVEVQIMGAGAQRAQAFGARLTRHARVKVTAAVYNAINSVFNSSAAPFLQALVIVALLCLLPSGPLQAPAMAGAIVAIVLLVPQALRPVQQFISFFAGINMSYPQVKVTLDLLETEPDVREKPGAAALRGDARDVRFESVTFSYTPDGRKILDGVTHTFAAGTTTAISARLGVGKSTALGLIMRLYDLQSGRICVGEQDIRDVTLASLRRHVVRVSQFPLYITDTVRANFQLAKPDATDAEIEAVCRTTGFWQNVLEPRAKEQGLANPLDLPFTREASGGLWSGGQRRLLALTRTLLLSPGVVLIDEPTTGVDQLAAHEIAGVLRGPAFADKTIILVDHNPEFLRLVADQIVCLEDGRFADTGTPAELFSRPSLFKQLLESFEPEPPSNAVKNRGTP